MSVDFLSPRPDLAYLSVGTTGGSSAPSATGSRLSLRAPGSGLSLARTPDPVRDQRVALSTLDVPTLDDDLELTLDAPAVRLNALQSGLGYLRVVNTQAFAWEDEELRGGLVVKGQDRPGAVVPVEGGRKVLEYVGDDIVLNLLHGKSMRRMVFGSQVANPTLITYGGRKVVIRGDGGANVLTAYWVEGGVLELRIERIMSSDLLGCFGIVESVV